MPPLHVSALHDIARAHDDNAPAGKARLVTFAGKVVRILRRLDCDWDLDDVPHDHRLWGVHPLSVRLFQKYNRDTAKQYPNFCTVVWIADDDGGDNVDDGTASVSLRDTAQVSKSNHHLTTRQRSKGSGESSSSSPSHSSSSRTKGAPIVVAAGIKRRAAEVVVIDSSDDDSAGNNHRHNVNGNSLSNGVARIQQPGRQGKNPAKRQRQLSDTDKTVAMILPWLEQTNPDQDRAIRPGMRLEIHRAVLHVGPRQELLACLFNARTTIDTGNHELQQNPDLSHHHRSLPQPGQNQSSDDLFQHLVAGRIPKRLPFDAIQYYEAGGEQRQTANRRSNARKVAATMAIVSEIKRIDVQTKSFHLHYLSDLYNTLASCTSSPPSASSASASPASPASSSSSSRVTPTGTSSSSIKKFPPHSETPRPPARHPPSTSSLPPPPQQPLSLQRVHRFLCWVTSLKSVHLRSVCAECGQAFKVDRCEFGCSASRKWQVCARASCIVSDGTGSALVHIDHEADVWSLLRLCPPTRTMSHSGCTGDDDSTLARLLRMLVRVGELAYLPPPSPSLSKSSSSSLAHHHRHQQQNQEPHNNDLSERGRTERELWSRICEQAVSPSPSSAPCRARLVLYARIKGLAPDSHTHNYSNDNSNSYHGRGLGSMYKGRFWIGGQSITTVFQSRVTLECLALEQLTEGHQGQQLTTSRKATVIESRLLLSKLLNK